MPVYGIVTLLAAKIPDAAEEEAKRLAWRAIRAEYPNAEGERHEETVHAERCNEAEGPEELFMEPHRHMHTYGYPPGYWATDEKDDYPMVERPRWGQRGVPGVA